MLEQMDFWGEAPAKGKKNMHPLVLLPKSSENFTTMNNSKLALCKVEQMV
jgi:hypothetical protein